MSSITIQGLIADAKVLTNTQSMLFPNTESVNKLRLSNTKAPANAVTNKTALEFRNTELGGYRLVHSYSNSGSGNPTPGTLTLEQFINDASVGTPIFTVNSAGIIDINFDDITVDSLTANTITTNTITSNTMAVSSIEASTSLEAPIIYANNYLVGAKIGLGILPGVINSALEFDQLETGRYITFFEADNNEHQYKGFGSVPNQLYAQLSSTSDSFRIRAATSSSASNTILTVNGNGDIASTGIITATRIGINITAANTRAALQFDNARSGRQIILYELANNIHQYRGLGTNATELFMQLSSTSDSFRIYAGVNSSSSNIIMTLTGGGILSVSDWVTATRASFTTTLTAGSASIGTTTESVDAVLTLSSSTKGLALPQLSNASRNSLTTTPGVIIYNFDQNTLQFNSPVGWLHVGTAPQALVVQQVAIPVQGGSSAALSWQDRPLNFTRYNTIVGFSLANNQMTFPIGLFEIEITAAHFGTGLTTIAIARIDNSSFSEGMVVNVGSTGGLVYFKERISVTTTANSANVYKIRSYTQNAVSNFGLGQSLISGAGVNNIYTKVSITQIR